MLSEEAENRVFRSQAPLWAWPRARSTESLSKDPSVYHVYKLVHVSENSWLMGEPVKSSEITLIILPPCYKRLVEKKEEMFKKMGGKWYTLVYPVLVGLVRFLTLPFVFHVVLLFIAVSIVMDILWMLGKLCKWMKCKQCNPVTSRTPKVGSNKLTCLYSRNKQCLLFCKATW
jgi:hypothetical protein